MNEGGAEGGKEGGGEINRGEAGGKNEEAARRGKEGVREIWREREKMKRDGQDSMYMYVGEGRVAGREDMKGWKGWERGRAEQEDEGKG